MTDRTPLPLSHGRRGSVYILVLAVLSVLVLITLTLSYISRMDLLSSRNWGNTVQSRMAAVTGVPLFQSNLTSSTAAAIIMPLGQLTDAPQQGAQRPREASNGSPSQNRGGERGRRGGARGAGMAGDQRGGPRERMDADGGPNSRMDRNRDGGRSSDDVEAFKLDIELKDAQSGSSSLGLRSSSARQSGMRQQGRGGAMRSPATGSEGGRPNPAMRQAPQQAQGQAQTQTPVSEADAEALKMTGGLATFQIEDESAKLNINAVVPDTAQARASGSQPITNTSNVSPRAAQVAATEADGAVTESQLAQLIQAVATVNHLNNVNPAPLAHQIALRRYGPNGKPDRAAAANNNSNTNSNSNNNGANESGRMTDANGRSGGMRGFSYGSNPNRMSGGQDAVKATVQPGTDPRLAAAGDDHPYASLMELMDVPGMTPVLYRALTPYLTTFSVSFAAFEMGQRAGRSSSAMGSALDSPERLSAPADGYPQIDPNTATPAQLLKALKRRFPRANPDLLGQFIANLIDRRDEDSLPTAVSIGGHTYYGMEINPCINEVCSDPAVSGAKDGQYVEIFNPWGKTFDLTGWSLRAEGMQVALNGQLASGAFLVLTNNFNNETNESSGNNGNNNSSQDGGERGSFYDLFHKVDTGAMHHLVESPTLSLASDHGKIQLVNPDGMVIDEFEYSGGKSQGSLKSFQRRDPRLRLAMLQTPTPLDTNVGAALTTDAKQALKIQEQWQNQPLRSPLDVMLISTAFAAEPGHGGRGGAHEHDDAAEAGNGADGSPPQDGLAGVPLPDGSEGAPDASGRGQSPAYAMAQLTADESSNLDVRLVDCFRLGAVIPPKVSPDQGNLIGQTDSGANAARTTAHSQGAETTLMAQVKLTLPPRCQTVFGRLNLNTAPIALLATLPGMDAQMLNRIASARSDEAMNGAGMNGASLNGAGRSSQKKAGSLADPAWWVAESPFAPPRWRNLSDYIQDDTLWAGRPLYDRLDAVYSYSQMVTMHTLAARVTTDSVQAEGNAKQVAATAGGGTRRPRVIRAERLIAADRGRAETVAFNYVGMYTVYQGDPDARYAALATQVQPLQLTSFIDNARKMNSLAKTRGGRGGVGLGSGAVQPAALKAAATAAALTAAANVKPPVIARGY